MDCKETERPALEKSESKSRDSKLNLDFSNNLSSNLKVSDLLCYVCAEINPQHLGFLHDGRIVNYCGDCFAIILEIKELHHD